jgi:hypothetical protein
MSFCQCLEIYVLVFLAELFRQIAEYQKIIRGYLSDNSAMAT